jgi:hypothetical protein
MHKLGNLALCAIFAAASQISFAECSAEQPALKTFAKAKGNSLKGPLSVAELERTHMIQLRESGKLLPFGYANEKWLEFKAATQPGDRIYFYIHRENRFYSDGHFLVRKGCIIRHLLGSIS